MLAETSVDVTHWPTGHTCPFLFMISIRWFANQLFFLFYFLIFFFLYDFRQKFASEKTFSSQKKLMVKSQMHSDVFSCLNLQSSWKSNLAWVKPAKYLHDYIKHFKSKFTSNQKT